MAWFSLRVREVPGSIAGAAPFLDEHKFERSFRLQLLAHFIDLQTKNTSQATPRARIRISFAAKLLEALALAWELLEELSLNSFRLWSSWRHPCTGFESCGTIYSCFEALGKALLRFWSMPLLTKNKLNQKFNSVWPRCTIQILHQWLNPSKIQKCIQVNKGPTVSKRQRGDLNPCGQSPMDF